MWFEQITFKIKDMPSVKKFKLRKIYQRKKILIHRGKTESIYLVIFLSNETKTQLIESLSDIQCNHLPSYLQADKINTGGTLVQLIPTNFNEFIRKDNTLKKCVAIFYNDKWYPGHILKSIKDYQKNLLSVLILLKELKK